MNDNQRSNWLASRLALAAVGLTLVASVVEFRPTSTEIAWRTYAEGLEEALTSGKPIYVDLYATWCGPCKEMDRITFRDDTVRRLLTDSYIPVRIDIDTRQFDDTLKARWSLRAVPTSMIVSASGSILGRRVGYQPPASFAAWLSDSALIAYAGWMSFEDARRRSREIQKPMLVVLTAAPRNLEEIQRFFLEPRFRQFIQDRFIVTRIAGEGPEEQAQYRLLGESVSLAPTPSNGFVMVIVSPEGHDLGGVVVTEEDLSDQIRIQKMLEGYLAKASATARR
jgi:thiol-disulfide isomerase/thioredoxin